MLDPELQRRLNRAFNRGYAAGFTVAILCTGIGFAAAIITGVLP